MNSLQVGPSFWYYLPPSVQEWWGTVGSFSVISAGFSFICLLVFMLVKNKFRNIEENMKDTRTELQNFSKKLDDVYLILLRGSCPVISAAHAQNPLVLENSRDVK